MKDITVKAKLLNKLLFSFGALAFVVMGFILIGVGIKMIIGYDSSETIIGYGAVLFGIIVILFFSLYFVSYLKLNFKRPYILVVNKDGIYDNTSAMQWGLIKWEDIKSIEKINFFNQEIIDIKVNNIESYMSRLNFILKMLQKQNIKMGFGISLVTNTMDYDVSLLFEQLQDYHRFIQTQNS